MKRNDVVIWTKPNGHEYAFFGRISRIEGDMAIWFCVGCRIHFTPISELTVYGYKGRSEWTIDSDEEGKPVKIYYHKDRNGDIVPERYEFGLPIGSKVKFIRPTRYYYLPSLRKLKQLASRYGGREAWKTSINSPSIYRP